MYEGTGHTDDLQNEFATDRVSSSAVPSAQQGGAPERPQQRQFAPQPIPRPPAPAPSPQHPSAGQSSAPQPPQPPPGAQQLKIRRLEDDEESGGDQGGSSWSNQMDTVLRGTQPVQPPQGGVPQRRPQPAAPPRPAPGPTPISRQTPPRPGPAPRPNGPSPFERAKAAFEGSPEQQAKLEALKNERGLDDDNGVFAMFEALGISHSFWKDQIPKLIQDEVPEAIKRAAATITIPEPHVDSGKIGKDVAAATTVALREILLSKWVVWSAIIVLIVTLLLGIVVGKTVESWQLADAYHDRIAALPHITAVAKTKVGADVMTLIAYNNSEALEDIVNCRPAAGLHLVRAQSGGAVCVGGGNAQRGWRRPPRLNR